MKNCDVEYIDNVLTVRFDKVGKGWEQWFQLSADRHHDDMYCDRQLEKKDLEKAKAKNAYILDFGDIFSLMQGKFDPRKSYDEMRPEYMKEPYLDTVVNLSAKEYKPYAKNWLMIGRGNHDASILKRQSTDVITRLVERLRSAGSKVVAGGYGGWIRFMFVMKTNTHETKRLYYHHGAGGSSPVTKGVIDASRQAVFLGNADIIVNGHNHNEYVMPTRRVYLNQAGKIESSAMTFVRVPGYKDWYGKDTKAMSWENQSMHSPKPTGCVWVRFFWEDGKICTSYELEV